MDFAVTLPPRTYPTRKTVADRSQGAQLAKPLLTLVK